MSARNPIAPLPFAPNTYDPKYTNELIRTLNLYFRQLQNPGPIYGSTLSLTNPPTSKTGLRSEDIWYDIGQDVLRMAGGGVLGSYYRPVYVTDPPYNADPTGSDYGTTAIQAAIDDLAAAGGGDVHLGGGTFLVDSVEDGASGYRIALRLKQGVRLIGPGTLTCNAGSDVDGDILVMVSIIGSDCEVRGVTFENSYSGSNSWRSVGVGCGDGLDPDAVPLSRVRIVGNTFHDHFYAVSIATLLTTETLQVDDIDIRGNTAYANRTSTFSGGYNLYSRYPACIRNFRIIGNYIDGPNNSSGINILGCVGGTVSANTAKDCAYGGVQTENGSRLISISGNTIIDCGRGVFVDDSADITVSGNTMSIVSMTPPSSSAVREGVLITRQGFSAGSNTGWVTDRINVIGNTIYNSRIRMSTFGTSPLGEFGTINIIGNVIHFPDGADANTSGITTAKGLYAQRILNNTVIGAAEYSIDVSAETDQPVIVMGNYTDKVGAEASVGLRMQGNGLCTMTGNYFNNGLSGTLTGIRAEAGNLDAGTGRRVRITNGLDILFGSGAPSVAASPGSLYLDTSGGTGNTLYVKEANFDSTGWVAK